MYQLFHVIFFFFLRRTLYDPLNDRTVKLSDSDLKLINRLRHGKTAGKLFEPPVRDIEIQQTAFHTQTPKSSFVPSKHVKKKVMRIVKAMRNGWIRLGDDKKEQVRLLVQYIVFFSLFLYLMKPKKKDKSFFLEVDLK